MSKWLESVSVPMSTADFNEAAQKVLGEEQFNELTRMRKSRRVIAMIALTNACHERLMKMTDMEARFEAFEARALLAEEALGGMSVNRFSVAPSRPSRLFSLG